MPWRNQCRNPGTERLSMNRGQRVEQSQFGRPLPPHPNPLPWGEEDQPPGSLARRRFVAEACHLVLPLPKGEGWGEGEGTTRTATPCYLTRRGAQFNSLVQ